MYDYGKGAALSVKPFASIYEGDQETVDVTVDNKANPWIRPSRC